MIHLTQSLTRIARQFPARLATICGDRRRTYGDLAERVARLAAALRDIGVRSGHRVAVLSLNSDRFLEIYLATWWSGAIAVPLNVRWSVSEMAYALDDSECRVLFVDDAFMPMVERLVGTARALRTVIHAGEQDAGPGLQRYEALIADCRGIADALRRDDDLACIFYTGGTTGRPKGVMLSHANLFGSALTGLAEGMVGDAEIGLHAAPMFHLGNGMFMLMLMLRGGTHVVIPTFTPEAVLAAIQDHAVTTTLLVPTMIQMVVDSPLLPTSRLGSLKRLVYGASPISEALLERAVARLPGVEFWQGYGQTEMSPLVSVLSDADHRHTDARRARRRSAGKVAVGVEAQILTGEGRLAAVGEVGEIVVRGAGVMQGYWNDPGQTAVALRNGWLHTGDAGTFDEDGFLYVVDRVKDMIVSGGENVYSAEVENVIAQHPAVASCAVIGLPDAKWGESVHAVIALRPGQEAIGVDEIKAHCRSLIAAYKCPRTIEFRDALPLSGAGKILKSALREPRDSSVERIGRMDA